MAARRGAARAAQFDMTGNMSKLRALLILGRVSNLPTVWSNCLAGWLLGGGGEWGRFVVLCLGEMGREMGGVSV